MSLDTGSTTEVRIQRSLENSLGPILGQALQEKNVVEIYRSSNGSIWIERLGCNPECVGNMADQDAASVVSLVASVMGRGVHADSPSISGTLPGSGDRFQGLMPPVTSSPVFVIRKRAHVVFTLDDYVESGTLDEVWGAYLKSAVRERKNILVVGGTGSGKTTLVNALLRELANDSCRVVLLEDTRELQCPAEDTESLLTKESEPRVSMQQLVRITLRMRPDRIVMGEVRGPEALDLLKAFNTGHPGGISTLHANSATDAIHRIEDLVGEALAGEGGVGQVPKRAIGSAIDLVAFIERDRSSPSGRRVKELVEVCGWTEQDGYDLQSCVTEEMFNQEMCEVQYEPQT
ncbi:P-type conjugative transfer ATPase TrbB [Planctomycetota bacterium]|nr:P-type conjugative transfer ATPase TrbB [Planctomycetota bacterium]